MFGGKKKESKRTSRSNNKYDIPNPMDFGINPADDDDDDDEALEAELRRLTSGDSTTYERAQPKAPPRKPKIQEIEKMSDEEMSDDDGEDDPAYLDELKGILGEEIDDTENKIENKEEEKVIVNPDQPTNENINIIEERITMYKAAENKAKADNEISKARRFTRGLKTLNELLKSVKAGNTINVDDIPPVLPHSALPKDPNQTEPENKAPSVVDEPVPTPEEPVIPVEEPTPQKVPVDEEKLELLKKRQREYKIAALKWKKAENVEEALKYIKISKQFDTVINALLSGEPIDLSDMPPPPSLPMSTAETPINTEAQEKQENETQEASVELAPVTGSGIEGALKERLEVYRRAKIVAEEENNTRKSRQYGRICKQYEDAIKLFTRGKTIPIDELPIPPGFPPIALEQSNPPAVSNSSIVTPSVPSRPAPQPPTDTSNSQVTEPKKLEEPKKPSGAMTRADKQILLLQKRQAELKRAALTAKKDGDIELAKEYLRQAKGIDPLINASRSGLPVDMTSIPISPNAKNQLLNSTDKSADDNFTIISTGEVTPINENSTDQEIYDNLEATLIKHKKMCLSTRDHTKALGDVPGYNRWERLALGYTKDLDMLRVQRREGLKPPRHHYEVRTYSIVQSSTDVSDGDVEISIIRGIDYSKEADTYVIYEFPYPSDSSPTDRTSTIKASNNPEYEATFTLNGIIDRSSRPCQRAFKRHALKCQVWSKGCSMNPLLCCTHPSGFFRSDSLLGTVTVKLQPLETQCTLHDSFPLMNGRKPAGGKLEVKIRLRDPITTKQIEKMTDKWLIIDN